MVIMLTLTVIWFQKTSQRKITILDNEKVWTITMMRFRLLLSVTSKNYKMVNDSKVRALEIRI